MMTPMSDREQAPHPEPKKATFTLSDDDIVVERVAPHQSGPRRAVHDAVIGSGVGYEGREEEAVHDADG
jgi:hypothetical protein